LLERFCQPHAKNNAARVLMTKRTCTDDPLIKVCLIGTMLNASFIQSERSTKQKRASPSTPELKIVFLIIGILKQTCNTVQVQISLHRPCSTGFLAPQCFALSLGFPVAQADDSTTDYVEDLAN
jgi:hypothetical protein